MSRDTAMSAGRSGAGPCEGPTNHESHEEEGPAPPDPPMGQEVTSPGAAEEGGRKCLHREASATGQPSLSEPRTGQEVTSPHVQRHRYEHTAVSPVKRERKSVRVRSLARSSFHSARRGQPEDPRCPGPFYFFGGANGADIVSSFCESKGWTRIYNKQREDFKLKWCESRSPANYSNFRAGEQLMFQIPNNNVLTTKIGLLSSLREYERVSSKVKHGQDIRKLKMDAFVPTTFRMDMRGEREAFFSQQEDLSNKQRHMWICKPTGLNQGRGIFLLKSLEDMNAFRHKLQEGQADHKPLHYHHQPQARIVQKYIQNPLLLKGRKFDVRSYLMIACTTPYMVFFRHGYVRLTCDLYDLNTNDMSTHLTNQCMQKKNPLYSQLKEDTVWSMESFNTYVNDRFAVAKDLPRDWVLGLFTKRMQQIMTQCFLSVKAKLDCRLGLFDLIGCDFMIDEDFNVWLLEMNCNPALHTNCSVLQEVIPSTVHETLDLTLEIFHKCRRGQSILPLSSQRDFVLLFKGVFPPTAVVSRNKSRTLTQSELCQKKKKRKKKNNNPQAEPTGWQPGLGSGSEKVSAGCSSKPAPSISPPQPTPGDPRPRMKKVTLKFSTILTSTAGPPDHVHVGPLGCTKAEVTLAERKEEQCVKSS